MSGIAGIRNMTGAPVAEDAIQCMVRALAHRGPDGMGTWSDDAVALGHCRLNATPEPDPQPLTNESGTLCLIADARVDNRRELQAQLRERGLPPRSDADGELILKAYEAWGEECPARILGDFAFAIWDCRRRELFCARDPIGVKPFYYAHDGQAFRWASEPNALFADGARPRRPNLKLICLYLLHQYAEAEETLDEGVCCLPAAHWLRLSGDKLVKTRYWSPNPSQRIHCKSDEEFAERFLSVFRESVRCRLRSSGPVGVLLSGGLDSSSIVCTAQALLREAASPAVRLEAYSLIFSDPECDERMHIEAVARHTKVPSQLFDTGQDKAWLDFGRWRHDPDVYYFPTVLDFGPVLQAAQQQGVRVLLDGVGGDDLLAANLAHLTDLLLEGRFGRLLGQLRQDASALGCSAVSLIERYCVRPLVPRFIKKLTRPWRQRLPAWINRDCLSRSGALDWLKVDRHLQPRQPSPSRQQIYEELVGGWNNLVALPAAERFNARFGIETRHPFWDRRLVEFVLALPHEQRWQGPWHKAVLRRAMKGILPESIRWRRDKAEFSGMIDEEFHNRQRMEFEEFVKGSILASLGVIHDDRWRQFVNQARKMPSPRDRVTLEIFTWLELWCRASRNLL